MKKRKNTLTKEQVKESFEAHGDGGDKRSGKRERPERRNDRRPSGSSDRPKRDKRFEKSDDKRSEKKYKRTRTEGADKKNEQPGKRRKTFSKENNQEARDTREKKQYKKRNDNDFEKRKPRKNTGKEKPAKHKSNPFEKFYVENKKKKREDFKVRDEVIPEKEKKRYGSKDITKKERRLSTKAKTFVPTEDGQLEEQMPLNKFVARAGICSRREAAALIKKGEVKVNGKVLNEPGYKVLENDVVEYEGNILNELERPVYFLLNKAKDFITTTDDPEGRKTVMDLFSNIQERIFPVGRLDRNTTGLLLLTNDGQLAQKLSHPKFKSKKVYQVKLDRDLEPEDYNKITAGLELEDGQAMVDSLAYTDSKNRSEVGIEIHIGKNRIVRRIFEHLDYEVKHLDRVMYAGLTKKNLPRGKWRPLTAKEIIFLKHFK